MRLLARYGSVDELATDVRDQLPRGGMVVRTLVPTGLQLFSPVEVAVECGGNAIVVAGQVLQIFPGIGVAVGLDRPARDRIEVLAGGERGASNEQTAPAAPRLAAEGGRPGDTGDIDVELAARLARGTSKPHQPPPALDLSEEPPPPRGHLAAGSSASIDPTSASLRDAARSGEARPFDRIQLALHGDREQRFAILRGKNRTLHVYVLRNPAITFDEICAIARMATVAPEVLVQIADRPEWGHRSEVAMALCRNPAAPITAAIRLLEHVSVTDLRLLAKDAGIREPIQRAARKKLLC